MRTIKAIYRRAVEWAGLVQPLISSSSLAVHLNTTGSVPVPVEQAGAQRPLVGRGARLASVRHS
jgi:hypothetical protein